MIFQCECFDLISKYQRKMNFQYIAQILAKILGWELTNRVAYRNESRLAGLIYKKSDPSQYDQDEVRNNSFFP